MILLVMTLIATFSKTRTQNDDEHYSQFLYKEQDDVPIEHHQFRRWYEKGYKPLQLPLQTTHGNGVSIICADRDKYIREKSGDSTAPVEVLLREYFNDVVTLFIVIFKLDCLTLQEWELYQQGDCAADQRYHISKDYEQKLLRVSNHGILSGTGCYFNKDGTFDIKDMDCVDSKLDIIGFEHKCNVVGNCYAHSLPEKLIYVEKFKNSQREGEIAEARCNTQRFPYSLFYLFCKKGKIRVEFNKTTVDDDMINSICDSNCNKIPNNALGWNIRCSDEPFTSMNSMVSCARVCNPPFVPTRNMSCRLSDNFWNLDVNCVHEVCLQKEDSPMKKELCGNNGGDVIDKSVLEKEEEEEEEDDENDVGIAVLKGFFFVAILWSSFAICYFLKNTIEYKCLKRKTKRIAQQINPQDHYDEISDVNDFNFQTQSGQVRYVSQIRSVNPNTRINDYDEVQEIDEVHGSPENYEPVMVKTSSVDGRKLTCEQQQNMTGIHNSSENSNERYEDIEVITTKQRGNMKGTVNRRADFAKDRRNKTYVNDIDIGNIQNQSTGEMARAVSRENLNDGNAFENIYTDINEGKMLDFDGNLHY